MAKCICPSSLKHRIELQAMTETRDVIGGLVTTWTTYATVRAAVRQASGREIWYRQQTATMATWSIDLRYRADVTTKHRAVYKGRVFEIRSVIDPEQSRRYLTLACDETGAP